MKSSSHVARLKHSDAVRVTFSVDRSTLDRLDQLVERAGGCSRSALVRLAIREMFQRLTAGDPGTESR